MVKGHKTGCWHWEAMSGLSLGPQSEGRKEGNLVCPQQTEELGLAVTMGNQRLKPVPKKLWMPGQGVEPTVELGLSQELLGQRMPGF